MHIWKLISYFSSATFKINNLPICFVHQSSTSLNSNLEKNQRNWQPRSQNFYRLRFDKPFRKHRSEVPLIEFACRTVTVPVLCLFDLTYRTTRPRSRLIRISNERVQTWPNIVDGPRQIASHNASKDAFADFILPRFTMVQ